jgi:hypothetical protein
LKLDGFGIISKIFIQIGIFTIRTRGSPGFGTSPAMDDGIGNCCHDGRCDPHVDLARANRPLFGVPDWIPPLPAELEIDFDQVMPPENHPRLSWEAIKNISKKIPAPVRNAS